MRYSWKKRREIRGRMGMKTIDAVEVITLVTTLLGVLFSLIRMRYQFDVYREAAENERTVYLVPIAARRIRQHAYHLLMQTTLLIGVAIGMTIEPGATQELLRGYAMAIFSIIVFVKTVLDIRDQRMLDHHPGEKI
jgi:hypothetical protein